MDKNVRQISVDSGVVEWIKLKAVHTSCALLTR